MRRICAVMIALALLGATPGIATADSTRQQAINAVIARALSQRGVPYAYGGGNAAAVRLASLGTPPLAPRVSRVGFAWSGLVLYAFAGVGIKMPRSSGEQYKVGRKILPSQALPGDLLFYGPEGS